MYKICWFRTTFDEYKMPLPRHSNILSRAFTIIFTIRLQYTEDIASRSAWLLLGQ